LAAHGAVFAFWLTAALAVAAYASGDRYPGFYLIWTGVLLGTAFVVPLGVLGAAAAWVRGLASGGTLTGAFCVLLAGALSLDVAPDLRAVTRLGAARLLALGAGVALAAWNLKRARVSRLGLGAAMAALCVVWMVSGLLRGAGVPEGLARPSILLPLVAAAVLLMPGVPRLDPLLSPLRGALTAVAAAVLVLLPLIPRVAQPSLLATPTKAAPPGGRSAVLIVLDTVRRDHMSLYGYSRRTTPAIERRAAGGLVFDDATSVASWTLPSHASMFTGLWPRTHGAHPFRGDQTQADNNIHPLAPEHVTLAEIARERGYRTAGLTANHVYMAPRWGVAQGFEEYLARGPRMPGISLDTARALGRAWDPRRTVYVEAPYLTAPEMTRAATAWLERNRDVPFFLFLNYMDAHIPNAAPGSQGLPFEDESLLVGTEKREWLDRFLGGGDMSAAEQRSFVNEYDRELIHLDRWVGVLLDYLERSGLASRTLVVLTADHGEALGEHHLLGHGKDLYAEAVDVPLVVWEPGTAPGRVGRPVQGLDLFPTILRYLALPIPEGTQGQPLLEADHATVSEEYYATHEMFFGPNRARFDRILRTIRVGGHRYFQSSNGEERLFDFTGDPGEVRNLIGGLPDVAALARARLAGWLQATPEAPPPVEAPLTTDPEALENLRALGYIR
jgi:arylsulfatase A-like enzyme